MADRTGGGRAPGIPGQQPHLLAAYGNALVAARGFGRAGNDGSIQQSP